MKKMFSIGLVLVMACSFVLAGQNKAEAMDNASAAILAGTMAIIGGAVISAIASDAYAADRAYAGWRPAAYHNVRTVIVYEHPGYKDRNRLYRRSWGAERERFSYERGGRHWR